MPLLARHEVVRESTYKYYDAVGALVDEHASRLFCRFVDDETHPCHPKA